MDLNDEPGSLEISDEASVLRFRRVLGHPPRLVWRALTDDEYLAGWFPTTIEGDRAAGAHLRFSFRHGEGESFQGEMLVYDPPEVMELQWADDVLRFELEPHEAGCLLVLTVTFPEHGKAARDATGWHVCLAQLACVCDGTSPPWEPTERWGQLHPRYVARLGPAASAIGPPVH